MSKQEHTQKIPNPPHHTLSLPAIILININIMMGLGIFINSVQLAQFTGALGALVYAIIGVAMLPLIISMARLLKLHPSGSFYIFGARELAPLWGFFSTWSYAVGKLASATIMVHFFSSILANLFPIVKCIGIIPLDIAIITFFTMLNLQNMRTGRTIQYIFLILKSIPVLFIILTGLFFISGAHFNPEHLIYTGIPSAVPLAIYTFLGFEASCTLSQHIENSEHNAPKALYFSYALAVTIACLFQLMMYGVLGTSLATATDYTQALPLFVSHIITIGSAQPIIKALLSLAVATSALGGAYGIMFSNTWNLNSLAHHGHLFKSRLMSTLNTHHMPVGCVLIQAVICFAYLALTKGYNVPLQYIASFGCVIAYTISIIALLCAEWRQKTTLRNRIIPILALINCCVLLGLCVNGFISKSVTTYLAVFITILIAGILMFWYRLKQEPNYVS
jgi:amino acid transporter